MCGIVGVVVKTQYGPTKAQEDAFYSMLFVDEIRGDDSTGVAFVQNNRDFTVMKDRWQPRWFIPEVKETPEGRAMFQKGKAFIGHNRKATIGKVTSETAHPFVVDNYFTMVHNGTIRNHKTFGKDFEVDSEALANLLAPILGPDYNDGAFEEAMGKVDGAYAVVAYNQKNHKLYLFRNSERPLCLIESKDAFFFGSEYGMIHWCASREGCDLKEAKAFLLKTHTLYSIDLETNKLEEEEFTPKKPLAVQVVSTTHHGATNGGKSTGANTDKEEGGELSKNELKRLRKRFLFTRIEWWADDYVEKNFPKTLEDGETVVQLMGVSDNLSLHHYVVGEFDLSAVGTKDFIGRKFSGRVVEMIYDKTSKLTQVRLGDIAMISDSTSAKKEQNANSVTVH